MLARLRARLTFANACSFLALLIALGTGSAYAANTVFSTDIVDGEVKTADLHGNAVTSNRIYPGSVTNTDIGADAVDGSKILDESLFDTDLAVGSVRTSQILDGQVGNADLANSAVNGAKVSNNSITTSDIAGAATSGAVSLSGIPNGRCSQVSLGVGGAQVGEVPALATNGAIQNGVFLYPMRVETAGHVEASICNFSGTSMTPITDLPVRIITVG